LLSVTVNLKVDVFIAEVVAGVTPKFLQLLHAAKEKQERLKRV